ncbi:autoinducer binding domain-containing protein [Variovorax sp. ZS18.2.2]|uniref:autoinducer binding domain-containing protein n=1 Tax=Variovorax sp. ZS18.2.2 TaxID=2971255 RepID=UPI0021516E87|nr:autoinducer binding domain-containing protein [Variovorax sp. ZS18.2.2]MCR6480873.1 autoinducer binding domain-containing protein [Variovorax sp. ZS18.2.2]
MRDWAREWLDGFEGAQHEQSVFDRLSAVSRDLGFDYCAYGMRMSLPLSRPKTVMRNDYPVAWQARYAEADYLRQDPTVAHGLHRLSPVVWSDVLFAGAPALWDEARSFGLRVGWAQSSLDSRAMRGMLTLARSTGELTAAELDANEIKMRWLANIAHQAFSRVLTADLPEPPSQTLTEREIEILKWSADGKTSDEISTILIISVNTVNFHVKNALTKLSVPNKTAAVVRAAMLGLLS